MRVGQNPVKAVENVAPPSPVTVVVMSYIPFLAGYYRDSLEVLKRCLDSIGANTEGDFDLMVFDNGSAELVREYLLGEQKAGHIQYLVLSERNLGKAGAWNVAFAGAPGEVIVYADSDIYFHPGWLQAHLEALEAFPEAGMVTGMPILTPLKYSSGTLEWAEEQKTVKVERGHLLAWEDFWRHARSLGDSEDEARQFYEENESVRLTVDGKAYYAGAAHFEFAARKRVLGELLPIPAERPMGRVRLLDEMMNAGGYLRLSTMEWYVEHMGNTVAAVDRGTARPPTRAKRPGGFWSWKPVRKALQWLYDRSFQRLYRN